MAAMTPPSLEISVQAAAPTEDIAALELADSAEVLVTETVGEVVMRPKLTVETLTEDEVVEELVIEEELPVLV